MNKHPIEWIKDQQHTIDLMIKHAAAYFYDAHSKEANFAFDLSECYSESLNLSKGEDLCYDRPNVALPYSLWYLGRRINTMISVLLPLYEKEVKEESDEIHLFDIGAGTGATLIAISIISEAFQKTGHTTPKLVIENIDTSPFMLEYCRTYLWPQFCQQYEGFSNIEVTYSVNSWVTHSEKEIMDPWFTASYLFDSSDNASTMANEFLKLVERFEPKRICLTSSNQRKKVSILEGIQEILEANSNYSSLTPSDMPFRGKMKEVNKARKFIKKNHQAGFTNDTTWSERSFFAISLSRNQKGLFTRKNLINKNTKIDLFNPPLVVRRDIKLNETQKEAAKLNGRPTIITGPAGCGKSVVLSERIKNVVENEGLPYDPKLHILVTTFNKDLMSYLSGWVIDLLDENKIEKANSQVIRFKNSKINNIQFMHFDVLPTRIGQFMGVLKFYEYHHHILNEILKAYKRKHKISPEHDDILNAEYLYEEYHRVFFGQKCKSKIAYLNASRGTRRPIIQANSTRRNYIADVIILYLNKLQSLKVDSIYTKRRKFLNDLTSGKHLALYSHIFVDEFQDCTAADYSIFYGLLRDNNNLVITGDFAQSVQLGNQSSIPREDNEFKNEGVVMRNRHKFTLTGSYRLPSRVSECISGLSKYIQEYHHQEADLISPYKGSPPGARPIIIYGKNKNQVANKLLAAINRFNIYDALDINAQPPKRITILEKDFELLGLLNSKKAGVADTGTILKLKGLEKLLIVFSTMAKIGDNDDQYHFIYTILTRTASLLFIVLSDESLPMYGQSLKLLREDRLIFWDDDSKLYFKSFIN